MKGIHTALVTPGSAVEKELRDAGVNAAVASAVAETRRQLEARVAAVRQQHAEGVSALLRRHARLHDERVMATLPPGAVRDAWDQVAKEQQQRHQSEEAAVPQPRKVSRRGTLPHIRAMANRGSLEDDESDCDSDSDSD